MFYVQTRNDKQRPFSMETNPDKATDLTNVPGPATDMDTDPRADEQVIDQTDGEPASRPDDINPSGIEKPTAEEGTTPVDELANALAYALDGSGTGIEGAPPVAPTVGDPQKVTSEGTTGAGLDNEEAALPK